jgi:hypothetical protein
MDMCCILGNDGPNGGADNAVASIPNMLPCQGMCISELNQNVPF